MQFYETCSDGFIVAEINGIVVGYIVGFQTLEQTGRIFSFAVHPDYQKRGIGSRLLKEMINLFSRAGVSEIILEVRISNIRAKNFYEKYGFYQISVLKRYYNDGENAYLMRLDLKNEMLS